MSTVLPSALKSCTLDKGNPLSTEDHRERGRVCRVGNLWLADAHTAKSVVAGYNQVESYVRHGDRHTRSAYAVDTLCASCAKKNPSKHVSQMGLYRSDARDGVDVTND